MRVLVTGHHGYIGAVLTPLVAAAGHDVVGLDTFFFRDCDLGPAEPWRDARALDVRDITTADLEGIDAIVHLAALSNDPLGDLNPAWTYDINRDGTIHLARLARDAGVRRFVFASSCSMYGSAGKDGLVDESSPLRPLTPYAESKVRAEEALFDLADDDFAPVSMRNSTAYGASPRLRLDIVLNNLVGWAHAFGTITLLSDGSAWRPLVHVRDITEVAIRLLDAPLEFIRGEAFNVGSSAQNYRIRDLAGLVQQAYPSCELTFSEAAGADPRSYRVDFAKLSRALPDFRCSWSAESGIAELSGVYAACGLDARGFEGPLYVRLRQLKKLLESGRLDDGLRWAPSGALAPQDESAS